MEPRLTAGLRVAGTEHVRWPEDPDELVVIGRADGERPVLVSAAAPTPTATALRTLGARIGRAGTGLGQVVVAVAGDDPAVTMANSAVYLEAFGHVVVAWIWLEQYLAAAGRDGDFYEGKRQAAGYFFRYELPRTYPQMDLLASLDRTTLDMQDDWF